MTVDSNLPYNTEEIFTQALERLEAGEPLEVIIAAYPAALHAELRDLLTVVAATHQLQEAEIPRPTAARRAANKRAFLQAAATMRAEMATADVPTGAQAIAATPAIVATVAAKPQTGATAVRTKPTVAAPTWLDRIRINWQNLLGSFTVAPMQLAPLVLMLTVISLGTFGFATVAQAAIPGDLAYPAKQWMRQQELNLAAEVDRPQIVDNIEKETLEDIAKARIRAAAEQKPARATQRLFFRGWEGGNLLLGSLVVEPSYQVNPPGAERAAIAMPQTPAEGQMVTIYYQIVPDASLTNTVEGGKAERQVVQGISLSVIEESIVVPTVTPMPTFTPTPCTVDIPRGWVPIAVRAGDTLSGIASRTGTNVVTLTEVNCLANPNVIPSGSRLFVPAAPTIAPTLTPMPSLEVILTAVSTTVSTEVVTPTQTVEPGATLSTTIGMTPTVTISTTATITPSPVVTATLGTPTVMPTETITATVAPAIETPTPGTPPPGPGLTLTLTTMATTVVTATAEPLSSATPTPPTDDSGGDDGTGEATAVTATADAADNDDNGGDEGKAAGTDALTPTATLTPTPVPPPTAARPTSDTAGRSGIATATPTAMDDSPLTSQP